jgi:hypothetical protein
MLVVLCRPPFLATSRPISKAFGDGVDGADDGLGFGRAMFMDFLDAVKLRDSCLKKVGDLETKQMVPSLLKAIIIALSALSYYFNQITLMFLSLTTISRNLDGSSICFIGK